MPQFNSPRFERFLIQAQTGGVGLINNSAGTWTPAGAQVIRVNDGSTSVLPVVQLIDQDWKTGARSAVAGISGRKNARFTINNFPVIPSGTAGTACDMDTLLAGIFGQPGVVAAGTSVTYSFSDNTFVPITLVKFQHLLPTLTQRIMGGATVEQASFTFNQNTFMCSFSGGGFYVIDNDNFANEDSTGKMGLSTFPLETQLGVGNTTVHGAILTGFAGSATFAGTLMTTITAPIISMSCTVKTGNILYTDPFGTVYPSIQGGGLRKITLAVEFMDTDSAALITLKNNAKSKVPFNVSVTIGTVAGSIMTFAINQVQIEIPAMTDDTARVKTAFAESEAHATVPGNVDDFSIVMT
jgi:hypothetical protein